MSEAKKGNKVLLYYNAEEYINIANEDGIERAVCDYIAGMSDTYALKIFNKLFVPMFWYD